MEMEWKYKTDLEDKDIFSEIEKNRGVAIPNELKDLIVEANAATPAKYKFMLGSTEKVLGSILSFNKNEEDADDVFTALDVIDNKNLVPFAIDPFGNYICFDVESKTVVFYDHETNKIDSTEKNITQLIESLY